MDYLVRRANHVCWACLSASTGRPFCVGSPMTFAEANEKAFRLCLHDMRRLRRTRSQKKLARLLRRRLDDTLHDLRCEHHFSCRYRRQLCHRWALYWHGRGSFSKAQRQRGHEQSLFVRRRRASKRRVVSHRLRQQGLSYRQIAARLGCSVQTAWADLRRPLVFDLLSVRTVPPTQPPRVSSCTRGVDNSLSKPQRKDNSHYPLRL